MERRPSGNFYMSKDETASEERNTKVDDDNSLSTMEDSLINKSVNVSHFSMKSVRFVPSIIEFIDAFEGKQFSVKLMIQNIGRDPIFIKLGEPNSFIFQLKKPIRRTKFLAAGSCITGTVSYTYHNDDLVQSSQIPVQINSRMVYYPILVKKAVPLIEVDPKNLHFKIIDLGASAKTMTLNIHNVGGKRTKFEVDVGKNPLDLVVRPLRGTVKAKDSVRVFVEIMGLREGEYYQELWIKTNETPIRIPVLVEVARPRLQILFPNGTEDLTLIDFPPTFNGAQRMNSFVLKNCSTETTLFITLAEVDGTPLLLKNAREISDPFSLFMLTAEEGRLEPFENRILNILFRPKVTVKSKGWHHQQNENKSLRLREIIVFFRIKRVHCLEYKELAKIDQSPNVFKVDKDNEHGFKYTSLEKESELTEYKSEFLRLCVHGQAVEPDITIRPSEFEFGTLCLGEARDKVLGVTNNSVIPVKCKLRKVLNVKTQPKEIWLPPEKGKEFLVTLTPRCAGNFKTKMKIEILAESDVPCKRKVFEIVAVYFVTFSYNAIDVQSSPLPKIGLGKPQVNSLVNPSTPSMTPLIPGITPLVTDEVGLQKESIKYKNAFDLPFAAVLGLKRGFQPLWMKKEEDFVNNVQNAMVALPNDRPRIFYSWPQEKICRTIFKGFFRYSPPLDLTYTLSLEGRIEKKERSALWNDYIRTLHQMRKKNSFQEFLKDEFGKFFPNKLSPKDLGKELEKLTDAVSKKCSKKTNPGLKTPLVPLSPLFLYNVNVDPKLINFGTVAVGTKAQEIITIKNMNQFSVGVKFEAGKSAVSVLEEGTIDVMPLATKLVHILFQSKELGRYFGFLNYIINGSHRFKISISASVTTKAVTVPDSFTSLEFGKYSPKDPFQPRSLYLPLKNFLQAPVKYKWDFSIDSAFSTDILKGEIPPRSMILTEIIFNLSPKKSFYSEVIFTSENVTKEIIKLSHPPKKVSVDFFNNRIDMHEIPLNLPAKTRALVLNSSYHEVSFEVITPNPMPGVKIDPLMGTMKPRSCFPIEITVQVPVIIKFSFDIVLLIHFVNKISVKISGTVVLPNIRMRPSEVIMRKICAQSFDTFSVCVENVGNTPAELAIDFRSCPEFSVADDQSKLYLPPGKSAKVVVTFEPNDVARYIFYLPVIINNILGPPMIQERESENVNYFLSAYEGLYKNFGEVVFSSNNKLKMPCVCLNSTVTSSLITVSPLQVNFQQESSLDFWFQPKIIEISNQYVDEVIFCIRTDDLNEVNDSPFNITPVVPESVEHRGRSLKARLGRGEKLLLSATFNPKKPGNYSVQVPLFVKGYSKGLVYNYIRLNGKLKPPRIYTNTSEVHIPPQPLGIPFEIVLTVYTENYRTNDIISCMVCDSQEGKDESLPELQPLTADWLKEPYVTQHNTSFDLLLKFQSPEPIALKTYVALVSSTGVNTTVLVTAAADNSSLTNHAFLTLYSSSYKLVKETSGNGMGTNEEVFGVDTNLFKTFIKTSKKDKIGDDSFSTHSLGMNGDFQKSEMLIPVEKGPRLIMKMSKSMSGSQNSRAVKTEQTESRKKNDSSSLLLQNKSDLNYNTPSQSDVLRESKTISSNRTKPTSLPVEEMTYPDFPVQDGFCKKYFQATLAYIERWIFEVVMRCDHYFSVPSSFQRLNELQPTSKGGASKKTGDSILEKDFFDFLEEVVGKERSLPERKLIDPKNTLTEKAHVTRSFFAEILKYLESKGCLLPHVDPEILMDYEYYVAYRESNENLEHFSCKILEVENPNSVKIPPEPVKTKAEKDVMARQTSSLFLSKDFWKKNLFESFLQSSETEVEKLDEGNLITTDVSKPRIQSIREINMEFEYPKKELDKIVFESRSIQAWFDVIIQIFKSLVLKKIMSKNPIPHVFAVDMNEKVPVQAADLNSVYNYNKRHKGTPLLPCVDSLSSNIYTTQERTLLVWLNHHLQTQTEVIWKSKHDCLFRGKTLMNFDKDLSDSVALIAVTAAYCPYIVANFFQDVFPKPESPNMLHHNAGKLIQAWRELSIGLTVENSDIVRPNPVFMVMLITHLYEVLPSLHPHTLISFSAPLNSEKSRMIQLKNESQQLLLYQAKFFGEHEGYFTMTTGSSVELKPSKTTVFNVTFSARKIKKITATLVLCGTVVSPNFAKHLAFYLEGKPSELPEHDKFAFSAPLYKTICTDIPVKPPYPEKDTYTIWYTTKQPTYEDEQDISTIFKPWFKIWHRKISRRLFLANAQVVINKDKAVGSLRVSIACFTHQNRCFWLLFRSNTSDFIVLLEIKAKILESRIPVPCFYSENWTPSATCTCMGENKLKVKESDCPLLTEFKIPARNEALWVGLQTMFLKAMHPQEKPFWVEHFETNIGINLILWMLPPDEEPEVIDEFVPVLSTRVTYNLTVENKASLVTIPSIIEIPDVRERSELSIPIHISQEAPEGFEFNLMMTSENEKEVRTFKISVQSCEVDTKKKYDTEETTTVGCPCRSSGTKTLGFCVQGNRKKTSKSKTDLSNF